MKVRQRLPWIIWCSALITLGLLGGALLRAADRASVPSSAAQDEALKLVKDVYGDEYAKANSSEQKTALAQRLLQTARETDQGTPNHYALLRVAWDVATQAGDAKLAMQVTDEMADAYNVDGLSAKVATVKTVAGLVRSPAQRTALATVAMEALEEAVAADDYDRAIELADASLAAARRAREWQLAKQIAARDSEIKEAAKAHEKIQAVLAKLEREPTDPAANQAAGAYFCFDKGDWARGIPMLALGSDATLKNLAVKDLEGATSPETQIALGDGWWELAGAREGKERDLLLVRAGYWYKQAQANLRSALDRVRIEKRLKEIAKTGHPIPEPPKKPSLAIAPLDENEAKGCQSDWSKYLHLPVVQTNSIGMKFALIPPGEFMMGSVNGPDKEKPQHKVRIIKPICLGVYEVTQEQYEQVMGVNPSGFKGRSLPVEQVNWGDVVRFCERLSALPSEKAAGRAYRLPTEAEWEYACRSGTTTRYYFGNDAASLGDYACHKGNSGERTQPVGQKKPNAWGLYDMHGNVYEWCQDWYEGNYSKLLQTDDPAGPLSGTRRVKRGGCWASDSPDSHRSALRNSGHPDYAHNFRGFRVALTLTP